MARLVLVHGLGGTGATMGPLADDLRALGHVVVAPTLPGHGTTPEDLVGRTWAQWLAAVRAAVADGGADVVVGQSMGAVLALAAAEDLAGVVAINPPAADPDALDGLEWHRSRGHDWIDGPPLADGEVGYTTFPINALIEMVAGTLATDLAAVTVPVLLVTSALDEVVDPASADTVAVSLGGAVQRVVLSNSGHVAVLGPERAAITRAIDEFVCTLAV